jgi:hypothetical protein
VTGKLTGLVVLGSLLLPGMAAAQPGASPAKDDRAAPGQQSKMYEDIEILRRLLNSKLLSEYPPAKALAEGQGSAVPYRFRLLNDPLTPEFYLQRSEPLMWESSLRPYNAWPQAPGSGAFYFPSRYENSWIAPVLAPDRVLDTEGTYLKGQGVVYTLTLPPPAHSPMEESSKPGPRTVSDWDRVRGQLHNEKPKSDDKEQPRKEPNLVEIILRVLADNGRHFAQLSDDESLIVIVTFRGNDPQPTKVADPEKSKTDPKRGHAPSGEDKSKDAGLLGSPSTAHDYQLLGELHLKQGNYEEAVKAWQKALELEPGTKQATLLYRKLAEAYLALGKDGEARQAIDKALESAKAGQAEGAKPSKQPEASCSPLPAKLIISASKKLLDQVGSGKIAGEEFHKAATVNYLTFPNANE